MNKLIIECHNLSKSFIDGSNQFAVLSGINLQIYPGEQVAIMGRSGSGKTTLLQLLAGLDDPTAGRIKILGVDLHRTSEAIKAKLRNQHIGFIYQLHHLIPEFTALENVCLPLLIKQQSHDLAIAVATKLLAEVDLSHRLHFYPNQLSGGEKQRVAIARAIINQPSCIFADEPTGSLDVESAEIVIKLLKDLARLHRSAIVMVTHDINLANKFDRIYQLENGHLI